MTNVENSNPPVKPSAVKLINFEDETVILAKITENGVLPPGEYKINVTVDPVGPSSAGVTCNICCNALKTEIELRAGVNSPM